MAYLLYNTLAVWQHFTVKKTFRQDKDFDLQN